MSLRKSARRHAAEYTPPRGRQVRCRLPARLSAREAANYALEFRAWMAAVYAAGGAVTPEEVETVELAAGSFETFRAALQALRNEKRS